MPATDSPRVAQLRSKKETLIDTLRTLDEEIRDIEHQLGTKRRRKPSVPPLRRPNARRLNEVTVNDAIEKLLREKRRAMHYKEIAKILVKEGRYKTKSKNFLSTVAITIMRNKKIEKVKPGVYRLKK